MNVLVTGGAGYIGSHAVRALRDAGHGCVVLDLLDRGHRAAVPPDVPLIKADLAETPVEELAERFRGHDLDAVLHFAALAYVGESVTEPLRYYHNNTVGSLNLLRAMDLAGIDRLVFSSTCATYGVPETLPITEQTPQRPINPYGWSKLMFERMLADHAASRPDFKYAQLRYFNVAGAAADGSIGEDHRPETHLIPNAIRAATGTGPALQVYGDDYDTPDGTCVRDYLHVEDLVDAHLRVLGVLASGLSEMASQSLTLNLGTGRGRSIREVIEAVQRATGRPVPYEMHPRRPGDPPTLYADVSKIREELGWSARHTDLTDIVASAYRWFRDRPAGYGSPATAGPVR
ncbi:MAG: UDP-glucose 4-epimerase GalE [Planctomycetota bacterium]